MSSSGLTPPVVDYGLVSGLNTQQIIAAELQPYEYPVTNLQNEQSTLNSNISDYQQINSDLSALETAAGALNTSSGWNARTATSSDSAAVTATASSGTPTGSIAFNVVQLASADSLVSSGSVSATSQIVTSAPTFLLSQGGGQLGLDSIAAGTGLALGAHTISVTQSSAAAATTGTTDLQSQSGVTVATGTNDTINVTVDNNAYSLVLAASPTGGYSGQQLLSAVQSAIAGAGASGVLQAGYDSAGHLVLSTVDQGSTQSLQVTGGDALATLGLSTTGALTGTDAVVSVDGTSNDLSTVAAGSAITLSGNNGAQVTATVAAPPSGSAPGASLLAVGSLTATNVSTGNGSLSDVVSNINAAGTGIIASAVQTGTNQYVLQMSSSTTGTDANLSVDSSAFAGSSLGSMTTASAGQNAEIQVGGAGGYTVSSQNNTFKGLLPGLSVTAQQVTSSPVTVSVSNDASAVAGLVNTMVTDANTVLSDVQQYAGYNEQTKKGGPLMGSATLQNLTNEVLNIFASTVGTSTLGSAVNAGITLSNGQISFDQTTFETAFNNDPAQVQGMFTQGGTFAPSASGYAGQVNFSYASNTTKPGTYQIVVNQSATQAVDSGATLSSGAVGAAETLNISMGAASAAYTTTAGQSLASIASGLNAAFAANNMGLSAQVVGGTQLQLRSDAYGSAASFTVTTNNTATGTLGLTGTGTSATMAGTDVAGTINGVAATGTGQYLAAPASDPTLGGLSLQVTAAGITSATTLGSFTYAPGVAQALSSLSSDMSDPSTGQITDTIRNLQSQSTGLTPQIQFYSSIVAQEQKMLMAKYANLESTLGNLKSQSSALSSQLSGMSSSGL